MNSFPFLSNKNIHQVETVPLLLHACGRVDGKDGVTHLSAALLQLYAPPSSTTTTMFYFKPSVRTDSPALERQIDSLHLKKEMSNI